MIALGVAVKSMKDCGNCKYWKLTKPGIGRCIYDVIFPDSSYAVSPGLRQEMRTNDGNNCLAFKEIKLIE